MVALQSICVWRVCLCKNIIDCIQVKFSKTGQIRIWTTKCVDACARLHTHPSIHIYIYLISLHADKFYFLYTHTCTSTSTSTNTYILCACVYNGVSILSIVAMLSKVSKTLISFLSTVSNGNVPDVYDCRFSLSFLVLSPAIPLSLSLCLYLALSLTRFFPADADTSCSGLTMGLPNRIIRIKVNLWLCWRIHYMNACVHVRMCDVS